MKSMIFIVLALQNALAYHDPDLNYHLSQVQKGSGCDNGYSYTAPGVQLTTTGVKAVAAPANAYLPQAVVSAPSYQYSGGSGYSSGGSSGYSSGGSAAYSTGITYQSAAPQVSYAAPQPQVSYAAPQPQVSYAAPQPQVSYAAPQPQVSYAAQPAATYQTSSVASNYNNYAAQGYTKEYHGYATSAGLSSAASGGKTVTPLATYAQAPIISKVTAAPLIAKFSLSPAKTSYVTQNLLAQQVYSAGSAAKASLNSYSNIQAGGPVVSQVYAAPSSGYATSPALRVQQSQIVGQAQYASVAAPAVAQYAQYTQVPVAAPVAHIAPAVAQYSTSSVSHGSAPSSSYFTPAVSQHSGGAFSQYSQHSGAAISQYSAPVVTQHAAQYASPVVQYSAPAVVQHSAPTVVQHSAPVVAQYSAPAVAQYAAPAVASVSQYASAPLGVAHVSAPAYATVAAPAVAKVAAPLAGKNVHTEFLENYDAHPRYAFEYSVNDPHTGDIKHQKEERDGEVVKGQYSLVEPDGSVRTVNYVADWETGFHADVRNSKDNQH